MKRIFVSFKMVNDYEQVLPEDWDAFLQEDAALDYVRQIVNCFDESALELALRIKDRILSAMDRGEKFSPGEGVSRMTLSYPVANKVLKKDGESFAIVRAVSSVSSPIWE